MRGSRGAIAAALVLLVPLLSLQPVLAQHCKTYSTSISDLEAGVIVVPVDLDAVLGIFYIVYDVCQPECILSYWVYDESNGIPGLQRGDVMHNDTCHHMIASDTVAL